MSGKVEVCGESADDFFEEPNYCLIKRTLAICGLWPYQTKKKRSVIFVSLYVGVITVVIPEVIYLVEVIKNTPKMIDCLPALFFTYGAAVMHLNSIIHLKQLRNIIESMKDNRSKLKNAEELATFARFAERGKLLCTAWGTLVSSSLVLFICAPLLPMFFDVIMPLNESRPIKNLLEVQYYVDPVKYYAPIFVHGLQAAVIVIFVIYTTDSFFVIIVQHCCSLFTILGYRIDQINTENAKLQGRVSNLRREKAICDRITECISYHRSCVRFAELIDNTLSKSWLMQVMINMLVISVTGVQTITRTNDIYLMLSFAMNTSSIVFRLYFISWSGQLMVDHSSEVYDFLCNANWYDFPPKAKKLIMFMMLRSFKPCNISVGKMAYMNLQTYCTLMQTSMSYFTMILSTQ